MNKKLDLLEKPAVFRPLMAGLILLLIALAGFATNAIAVVGGAIFVFGISMVCFGEAWRNAKMILVGKPIRDEGKISIDGGESWVQINHGGHDSACHDDSVCSGDSDGGD